MTWFIYSCCAKLFALVKTPWGPPSVALHTSTTWSGGCDSFDILSPSLWMSRIEKNWENHQRKSDSTLFLSRKKTRTNSWIWNQSKPGSVHRSDIQILVTIWSWLKSSVSVDISDLWGIPSRQLTAGVSVIQYLQGMRKWERCNRRHRTRRFQLFLTAFMKIEAQRGVQYEQQNYKKTWSEKENSQAKINAVVCRCWLTAENSVCLRKRRSSNHVAVCRQVEQWWSKNLQHK